MLVNVDLPPGLMANGTARQAKNRWRDGNLVRWPDGRNLQPVGGWVAMTASTVTGKARACLPWAATNGNRWLGIGTHSKLYALSEGGTLSDITPSGFTAGSADAVSSTGYGGGAYGEGTYGTPRPDTGSFTPASVWSLDTWGQYLVGCMEGDGKLYEWQLNTANPAAAISGAPTGCTGLVVTAERFIFALKNRTVLWCDQGVNTDWTAGATDQAGDQDLDTAGRLLCGQQVSGGTLIFTTTDVWLATYQGLPAVYGFAKVGDDCGPVSKGAVASVDGRAVWMTASGFCTYDGGVTQLSSEVADYVFSDISPSSLSKVSAWHNTAFSEVWWFYPSGSTTENDRYVKWNYLTNSWDYGSLSRTCGASAGVFTYPICIDADGAIWNHETGWTWSGAVPYARTGPFEWTGPAGGSDRRSLIRGFIPDEETVGDSQVTFYAREWPNATEETFGPFPITTAPVDCLFSGRGIEMKISFVQPRDARAGIYQFDVTPLSAR
jgi:hypothetical protein